MIDKTPVHLIANWNSPSNFGLKFHAENVLIELLPIESAVVYKGFEVIEPTKANPIRRYKPKVIKSYFMDKISAKYKPGFLRQAVNFIETCVLNNYNNTQASNLKSALKITDACMQIMYGVKNK